MADDLDEGFTSFPLSGSLPNSPLAPPEEDGTFSILPRYLLQKVKNTFGASETSRPSTSRHNSGSTHNSSSNKSVRAATFSAKDAAGSTNPAATSNGNAVQHQTTRSNNAGHHVATVQPRIASIRDEAGSTVSRRSHRLSTVGSTRRTLPPILSKPYQESVKQSPYLATTNTLSRSHSQSLATLPEGSLDYSPPPPYSTSPSTPYNVIPGFPINNDDTKSVSSVGGSNNMGVTQIFRRLRGEALSRDYW
jgi:hypothetical protein